MPEYLFKPTVENIVKVLEKIASKYKIEKREDLSHDGIHRWDGSIREKPELWLTDVPVEIIYNPKSEFPLCIGTLGPYLASEIPHLKKLLKEYQRATKSKKIWTDSPFG